MTALAPDTCAVLSPGGRRVAVTQGSRLRVYDVQGEQPRLRYSAEAMATIRAIAFSGDSEMLLTGAEDGSVAIWEVTRTAKPTYTFRSHTEASIAVAWSETEGLFTSASRDGSIVVYGVDGQRRQRYDNGSAIHSIALTLGACLLTGDEDGNVRLWTPFDDEPVIRRRFRHPLALLAVSADERTHAALEADGALTAWRAVETVGEQRYPSVPKAMHFHPKQSELLGVALGRRLDVFWVTGELQLSRRLELPFAAQDFAWTEAAGGIVALGLEGDRLLLHRGDATLSLPTGLGV